ncbi:phospholipase D family protein [Ponticoccus alexandrii]|uniref:Phospholipase D n=1 Tax=Ponticoccus alexandrii TaxID=1943633 RepID=A0ABX7FB76_9RHOB|nr:phospholipase D family protein [Ponticoccus alexandrii]ETA49310.1 cardiolipin synthase [Rhodobacteraceae bacterium PD-2]QRF67729.1 cardiolipin synthase [Ponticoccus alexandrii]
MTPQALITAAEGFPALERLVASATEDLVMSFRILDPKTRLRDPDLRERGLETWSDLISWTARRGVSIRLLIADFDPIFTSGLHRNAWACASGFADVAGETTQILCATHGQQAGALWRIAMMRKINETMASLRGEDPTRLTPVQRKMLERGPVLRPVTLHQKFAIADGERCIIGGLDINERRYDTPDHDRAAEETWHDISVELADRDFAGALFGHFADCWNAALRCGSPSLATRAVPIELPRRMQSRPEVKLLRTFSNPCPGPARISPQPKAMDHETAHHKLFAEAERFIYIETQFLRHAPIADALCEAARRAPDLQLLTIMPAAPDRVLFEGDRSINARHAHGLQVAQMDKLRTAFGERYTALCPAQPRSRNPDEPELDEAALVYLHSKVTMVDNKAVVIGSANLNGRSLRWDSEASVLLRDPAFCETFFDRLTGKWLRGKAEGAELTRAKTWAEIAESEQAKKPDQRETFLLPFPMQKARRFARRINLLPDDMF